MTWQGVDKRIFPRANYPCTVRIRSKGSAEAFRTKTENIGCGGICVILPKDVGMFNPVEVEIELASANEQRKISCDGTVVWVVRRGQVGKDLPNSFDTGIEFIGLKPEDKLLIERVVTECLQKNTSSKSAS
ncbi:MAG: PilZ domain-containing protein [Candidatus Omnitrophica bacterium]|nr:PilZ domain-containing protein [Candidatus Omnitrophota bacterium]MDD5351582.1 PilZ domain-containing protein [Candidatus Omnitrophota bacterium]MDD5551017.1 PilZ domain-containing protein [Candidatus Omnitrophota bacterium]